MSNSITPTTKSIRSPWLPGSVEDRCIPPNKTSSPRTPRAVQGSPGPRPPKKEGSSQQAPRAASSGPSVSPRCSPDAVSLYPLSQPSSSNKSTGSAISDAELDSESSESPESPPTLIIPMDLDRNGHPEITISSKMKSIHKCDGVSKFCLFEGASNAIVSNPLAVLGSITYPINIGDIYTHTYTTTSGTNSTTVQVWMFVADLWKDITQDLNAHRHISHPSTNKLALWMKDKPPNYIKIDTYKRYLRNSNS